MRTILIVDDNAPIRELLRGVLRDEGYRVVEAATGRQGLALAATVQPDLVLLDVMLPDLDGRRVCAKLRDSPTTSSIPIVMMTAASQIDLSGSAHDAFLCKPFDLIWLLELLGKLIDDRPTG